MNTKNNIFRLTGKVQHYQWGGFEYIPALLGIDNNKHLPFAEYWLGAHENAPSQLGNGENMDQFLKENPAYLGKKTKKAFGRLPYLLKILDVKDMLSIQVHPTRKAALIEFARENKLGIPFNAPNRNYKDDNHKPELMMALSEFWLLHGFQSPQGLIQTIKGVPEFDFMVPVFKKDNYKALYELVMTMDQSKVNEVLQPLLDRIVPLYQADKLKKDGPDFWAARAALTFNETGTDDRGLCSGARVNIVHLKQGAAVFQDAGIQHAYLEGQNVEIMANSDNVLRGGLTPKHIDVKELMKHVVFEPVTPHIIQGRPISETEEVFITPAPDFELSRIVMDADQTCRLHIASADIFLVLNGMVDAVSETNNLTFTRGEAFVAVSHTVLTLKTASGAEIYRASVPAND
ncbi:MAG: mannose-6-phosphate isomerase, class I [Chitinophagaceae bacterium]